MLIHAYCTVTYNYSTNFLPTGYRFHLIDPDEFIELVATVVGDTFNIKTLLTFTKGRDGGRDAAADYVNIDLGEENILVNQNLVVKVEHSKDESKTIDDDMRRDLFEKDKNNVEELVQKNQLDTYMVVTNYILLTNQSTKLVKFFKNAGVKSVIIVGKGTLSCWLNVSPELESKVIRQYPDLIDQTTVQILERYREDLKKTIDVEAFTKAKKIVESDKGLVFITGAPGIGKTTVAKQLIVHLSKIYEFFYIAKTDRFIENWNPNLKRVFFINNIDSDDVDEWCKLDDILETTIEKGSKFVIAGKTEVLVRARRTLNMFCDRLCDAAINLSEIKLSENKKREMLKKHIRMGDNPEWAKEALLKGDLVSRAVEIDCSCFPLVASSFGSRDCFEKVGLKVHVHNKGFLRQFFKWVEESTAVPKRPQLQSKLRFTDDNGDNMTGL